VLVLASAGLIKSLAYSLYLSKSCLVVVEIGCILILEGLSFLGDGSTVHGFSVWVGFSLVAILQSEGEAYFLHEVSMTGDAETASAGISL
jgi:hypothetical protein